MFQKKISLSVEINDIVKCPLFIPSNYLTTHCSACLFLSKQKGVLVACAELSGKECPLSI